MRVAAESAVMDLRDAVRGLLRRKPFVVAVVLTLGLGIGAVCTLFSVVDSVLLRPLALPDAARLVWIGWQRAGAFSQSGPSLQDVAAWNAGSRTVLHAAGYAQLLVDARLGNENRQLPAALVSGAFFQAVGRRPLQGRWLLPDDDVPGGNYAVVLSYDAWGELSAKDDRIIGRELSIDGRVATVVGVMPPSFSFPSMHTALWIPIRAKIGAAIDTRALRFEGAIARRGRADLPGVQRELLGLSRHADAAPEPVDDARSLRVVPLQRIVVGDVGGTLYLLFGASLLVLLATCINAGSLLVARDLGRRREFALRRAVGVPALRLVQRLVFEGLLLALLGAAVGLGLAFTSLPVVKRLGLELIPRATEIALNGDVLLFALVLVAVTAVGVTVAPAIAAARVDPAIALQADSTRLSSTRGSARARQAILFAQVALTLVILSGAGVLGKSVALLLGGAPGMSSDHIVTTLVQRPVDEWLRNKEATRQFGNEMVTQIDRIPGVRQAAIGLELPTADYVRGWMRLADGALNAADTPSVAFQVATPSYFSMLGLPILAGRNFDDRDARARPPTLILSRSTARRLFGESSAVGGRVFSRSNDEDSTNVDSAYEIVGVVGDIRPPGPALAPIPLVYIPFDRSPVPHMTVLVRSTLPTSVITPAVQRVLGALDRSQPPQSVRPLDDVLAQSAARPRFYLLLLGSFAMLSLFLTTVGVYGVTTFATRQRSREIGVRIALGARRRGILVHVLRENARAVTLGIIAGLGGAVASTRLLRGLLAGVSPSDPAVLLVVSVILFTAAVVATLVPAFHATRIDPVIALRSDG